MKVVQINAVYHFSSTGRTTEDMHLYLQSKGVDSYVFCVNRDDAVNGIFSIGSIVDHKLHAVLSRATGLRGYYSTLATNKLIKKLKQIHPDIVVLRNLHSNFIDMPRIMRFLASNQAKTVWVLHDCWAYTGGCTHYTIQQCFKWQTQCCDCPWKGNDGSWFFDRSAKVFNDRKKLFGGIRDLTIIGVSDWVTNEARKSFFKDFAKRIERFYNWIDLNVFYPREVHELRKKHDLTENDFVILGAAQLWTEKKGLSHFINIAQHFPKAKVIMIGTLDMEMPENVIHVDAIDNTSLMAEYYSLADVFINFSKQETFGKVAAEALACGTPVIANNNTANPEIVGDCGYVITNDNEPECYKAIGTIMTQGKSFYTKKCVERVHILFNKEKILDDYFTLFKQIIKE